MRHPEKDLGCYHWIMAAGTILYCNGTNNALRDRTSAANDVIVLPARVITWRLKCKPVEISVTFLTLQQLGKTNR